jgi:hypothetical protein
MEFETITQEDFSSKTKSGGKSVWSAEFKTELKSALDERKNADDEQKTFRIPMSYFLKGYLGTSKNPKIPAHNLVLSLIGINYETDKDSREVVQKNGDAIEVDFTKMK